jgi:hypothetical protein
MPTRKTVDTPKYNSLLHSSSMKQQPVKVTESRMTVGSYTSTESKKVVKYNEANSVMFIPCTNCNNMIHYDDIGILKILIIDEHSNKCVRVKEEVIVAEGSNFTYHTIDHKLRKLEEHLTSIKNQDSNGRVIILKLVKNTPTFNELVKDMHYLLPLRQYILDVMEISTISQISITNLKKILTNIDVIFFIKLDTNNDL